MTQFDLSKVQSSSLTKGLQDLGTVTTSATYTITMPTAGSIVTQTLPLNFKRSDVMSVMRVNVVGHHLGSYWFPLMSSLTLFDGTIVGNSISNGYAMYFLVQGTTTGRNINIQFVNETVGASVTTPALTITIIARLYSYPW